MPTFLIRCNPFCSFIDLLAVSDLPHIDNLGRPILHDIVQASSARHLQIVVEPSGAAALAATLSPQMETVPDWEELQNIGIILSGGNIDIAAKGFWQLWSL